VRVALALGLLLLASPALGDVVYVPETPGGADVSGYSVGADTIYFANQAYTSTLAPTVAGTEERPKVWIGQGAGVTFAGIVPKSHNRFYNMTSTAGVTFPVDGKHVMFNGCTLGGLNMMDADSSSVRNCTVRGTQLRVARGVTGGNNADADTLEWCTFTALSASGSEPGMYFGDNDTGIGSAGTDSCRYFVQRFNTFNISQSGASASTFSKHYECPNFYSYGNTYVLTSTTTAAGDEANYGVLFRDACYSGVMKRDRIFVNNEGSTQSIYGLLFTSGMVGNAKTNHHWAVDSCYVRVFRGSAFYFNTPMPSFKMRNCVLRSRLGTALEVANGYDNTADDPYIHHNTFMGKQAVYYSEYANNGGGFSGNVLWGTSTSPCDAYQAVGGTTGNLTSFSDSNLVFSTTMDNARAFCKTACAPPAAGPWATSYSNDTHSYWYDPQFSDTSWASLNVAPISSFVTSSAFTLRYAGASNGVGSVLPWGTTARRTPPAYWGGDSNYLMPDFYRREGDE